MQRLREYITLAINEIKAKLFVRKLLKTIKLIQSFDESQKELLLMCFDTEQLRTQVKLRDFLLAMGYDG